MIFTDSLWSDEIADDLAMIADEVTPLDWYRDGVKERRLGCWTIWIDGARVGTVLWRRDRNAAGGHDFVVVAAVGNHPKFDLARTVVPFLEAKARMLNCQQLRLHTQRIGLVKVMRSLGFGEAEYVMRKALP